MTFLSPSGVLRHARKSCHTSTTMIPATHLMLIFPYRARIWLEIQARTTSEFDSHARSRGSSPPRHGDILHDTDAPCHWVPGERGDEGRGMSVVRWSRPAQASYIARHHRAGEIDESPSRIMEPPGSSDFLKTDFSDSRGESRLVPCETNGFQALRLVCGARPRSGLVAC